MAVEEWCLELGQHSSHKTCVGVGPQSRCPICKICNSCGLGANCTCAIIKVLIACVIPRRRLLPDCCCAELSARVTGLLSSRCPHQVCAGVACKPQPRPRLDPCRAAPGLVQSMLFEEILVGSTASQPSVASRQRASHAGAALEGSRALRKRAREGVSSEFLGSLWARREALVQAVFDSLAAVDWRPCQRSPGRPAVMAALRSEGGKGHL